MSCFVIPPSWQLKLIPLQKMAYEKENLDRDRVLAENMSKKKNDRRGRNK